MPRSGKRGNAGNTSHRSPRAGPPQRKVVIPLDIAKDLRKIAPDMQLQQLVETLLIKFLIETKDQRP